MSTCLADMLVVQRVNFQGLGDHIYLISSPRTVGTMSLWEHDVDAAAGTSRPVVRQGRSHGCRSEGRPVSIISSRELLGNMSLKEHNRPNAAYKPLGSLYGSFALSTPSVDVRYRVSND